MKKVHSSAYFFSGGAVLCGGSLFAGFQKYRKPELENNEKGGIP
jgi:hypothetical protein